MYLFFDTETTGLPRSWSAPISDSQNWPRMVQLAWILYDNSGKLLDKRDYIIYPEGYTIPYIVTRIHGISTEKARLEGVPLIGVMEELHGYILDADFLVAHNFSFDEKIIGAEFYRTGMSNPIALKEHICTMKTTAKYCAIPSKRGPKWPTLDELHYTLFQQRFQNAHDAAVDIEATARCFWELRNRGVL